MFIQRERRAGEGWMKGNVQCLCVPGEAPPLPGPMGVAGGGFSQGTATKKKKEQGMEVA